MPDRILILERDPSDPAVWSYGLAADDGQLTAERYRLRHYPATGSEPIGALHEMLWPTAVLLVRQAGARNRVVYNLTPAGDAPEPPPRPPERRWERSTARKRRGAGETLAQRAERAQRGEPRVAA